MSLFPFWPSLRWIFQENTPCFETELMIELSCVLKRLTKLLKLTEHWRLTIPISMSQLDTLIQIRDAAAKDLQYINPLSFDLMTSIKGASRAPYQPRIQYQFLHARGRYRQVKFNDRLNKTQVNIL